MKRALSIFFPMLPIEALRRRDRRLSGRPNASHDKEAIFLITKDAQREVIACCCERSAHHGICPLMPVAQARALMPGKSIRIERFDSLMNGRVLRGLAVFAHRFSPIVAMDEPDGLFLDVTGCERVFHGEQRLMKKIHADFARLGFMLRTAIAPTFASAWAVARFSQSHSTIIPEGAQREAMRLLPTAALRLEPDVIAGLEEVGIENVGQLFDIPRSVLPARFGDQLLLRLDQMLGRAIEMMAPIRLPVPLQAHRSFDGPTTQVEAIHTTIIDLLDKLSRKLLTRESGASRINIDLARSDLPALRLSISLSRPHRDRKHLWSLIYPKIEDANLGFGVEAITLTAEHIGRLPHEQIERWHDASTVRCDAVSALHIGELTDALISRLGDDRVRRVSLVESHIPESSFVRPTTSRIAKIEHEPLPRTHADRPTILFDRPVAAHVTSLIPDGPVQTIRWGQTSQSVIATIGPERLGPVWWQSRRGPLHGGTRDYFQVQEASGRWLWIYREYMSALATPRWFVHGVWA